LKSHGVTPAVIPSDVDETLPESLVARPVEDIVVYLARKKADAVRAALRSGEGNDAAGGAAFILAADTVVYKDRIIGKPVDEADAFHILSSLRASAHRVITGVCLIDAESGEAQGFFDTTEVYFKDYPDAEIYRYIREDPPYDKSGSYAVRSSWSRNIERVEGDIENVMGLPWYRVAPLIARRRT
jgi:septum formation protein